jgi:hypothetical protein
MDVTFLGKAAEAILTVLLCVLIMSIYSRTWSPAILEALVEDLGYEMKGRMVVYFSSQY